MGTTPAPASCSLDLASLSVDMAQHHDLVSMVSFTASSEPSTAEQQARKAMKSKDWGQAITILTRILVDREDSALLCNRARCHMELNDPHSALADATKALELDPKFSKAYQRMHRLT